MDSFECDSDSLARKSMSLSAFVCDDIESVLTNILSTEDLEDR